MRIGAMMRAVCETAWAMDRGVLENMVSVVMRHDRGETLSESEVGAIVRGRRVSETAMLSETLRAEELAGISDENGGETRAAPPLYSRRGSVAVIPVGGIIAKYASAVGGSSQPRGTATQTVQRALDAAVRDTEISSILVMIDSPGGSVAGVGTLAEAMRGADAVKPVFAYADDLAASAAYWIASAARAIYSTGTASVGSIGVYTVLVDSSRAYENEGVRVEVVKAGARKAIGTPGTAITEEDKAVVQENIDAFYELFVDSVAKGRSGLSKAKVRELADGRVLIGKAAVEAGLVDGIKAVDAVISEMNRKFGKKSGGPIGASGRAGASVAAAEDHSNPVGGEHTEGTMKIASLVLAAGAAVAGIEGGGGGGAVAVAEPPKAEGVSAAEMAAIVAKANADAALRVREIDAACGAFHHVEGVAGIRAAALADAGVSVDKVRADVLKIVGDSLRPTGIVTVGESGHARERQALEAVIIGRISPNVINAIESGGARAEAAAKALKFGDAAAFLRIRAEAAREGLARMPLMQLCERGIRTNAARTGRKVGMWESSDQMLVEGLSMTTSDFPLLLEAAAGKVLMTPLTEQQTIWRAVARKGTNTDFKERKLVQMSEAGDLQLIPEGQREKYASFNERRNVTQLETYGRGLSITRQMIYNDDLGAFSQIVQYQAAAADRLPDQLLMDLLSANTATGPAMGDGTVLFHSTHNNLLSAAALSRAALTVAYTAFLKLRGFGSDRAYMEIMPKVLLTPAELWETGELLTTNPTDPTAAAANVNVKNVFQGKLQHVSSGRLSAVSTTGWYLFADPAVVPALEVSFLNGNERPTLAAISDGDVLTKRWQVIFDCDVAAVQYEGVMRNPGS